MGTVLLGLQVEARDPLPDKPTVLPRAHVIHVVVAAREDRIVQGGTASFKPGEQGLPSWFNDLELHRSHGLLQHRDRPLTDATTGCYVSNPDFDDGAATKFAVDCEVEE